MSKPTLMPHQTDGADWCVNTLEAYGLAYLAYAERTGKTLTALEVVERLYSSALVVTTKKAMQGWEDAIKSFSTKRITIINYHSVHKVEGSFDVVILDEAHKNISMCGKAGTLWKALRPLTKGKPIIYLSATPSAQSMGQLFNQLALSDSSPFASFKANYFNWHRAGYGIPKQVRTPYGYATKWDEVHSEKVWEEVKHLFQSITREEVGHKHEAKDVLHDVELPREIKTLLNTLSRHYVANHEGIEIVCESAASLAIRLHQLSGGTLKNVSHTFHDSKVRYIRERFGTCEEYAIFHQYIAEGELLSREFPECPLVGQITRFAEGVDLSHLKGIIFYSMNWSVATYSQARNRCCNINRKEPIETHFILGASIDRMIYEAVAIKKQDFDGRYYERTKHTEEDY